MWIRDVMTRDVRICRDDDDIASAGKTMIEAGCGALPVCSADGEVAGFVTDRDLCAHLCCKDLQPSKTKVADAMHREVWACAPDHTVEVALEIMRRHHVRRLPVLDDRNRLVGIVSIDDIAMRSRPVVQTYDGPADADVAQTLRSVGHALPRSRAPI
jgi:CBS domain-containing protein